MKNEKRWCKYYSQGNCTAVKKSLHPTKAIKTEETRKAIDTSIITDPFIIASTYAFYDNVIPDPLPKEVILKTERVEIVIVYKCKEKRSKRKQMLCSEYL